MNEYQVMYRRLRYGTQFPNAWIVSQGYSWVKRYLHTPVRHLNQLYQMRAGKKQLGTMYDGLTILSDVNIILESYVTAYHWCKQAYEIDFSTNDMLDDMLYLSHASGITKNLALYEKQYLALNPDQNPDDLSRYEVPRDREIVLRQRHRLNMFHPAKVIETIVDEDDAELNLIKTLAYGATRQVDIFMARLRKHVETGGVLESQHLYYFPMSVLDASYFWKWIIESKTQIALCSCDFDNIVSNRKSPTEDDLRYMREYQEMPPYLHLARTEQDVDEMKSLARCYPSWKDPKLCVKYFRKHARMPTWKEYYSLSDFSTMTFHYGDRPDRLE